MIVNIRGTGGSGKSTIVRKIANLYSGGTEAFYIDGRKQPYFYLCSRANNEGRQLCIVGGYETPTGGCDNIKTVDEAYTIVRSQAEQGRDVLFEGIMVQDDVRRFIELSAQFPTAVVYLTTPLEQCLAGIQSRRDARGDDRPMKSENTKKRMDRQVRSMIPRLEKASVRVVKTDRDDAVVQVASLLGVSL